MKKIGILAMVLVLCLAAVGVGYAGWTDSININGTVSTGNLDINVTGLSGTEVYKNLDTDEMVVCSWTQDVGGAKVYNVVPATGLLLVASSGSTAEEDSVTLTFDNLFPSVVFSADAEFTYVGSVPAKVQSIVTDGLPTGIDNLEVSATLMRVSDSEEIELGTQLHDGDVLKLVVTIEVPQDNALMNLSFGGNCTIDLIQWNEYVAPS